MIEKPPHRSLRYPNFTEALSGLAWLENESVKKAIRSINENYEYWDKAKYRSLPDDVRPEDLWAVVKMIRDVGSLPVKFGKRLFKYNSTPFIQITRRLFLVGLIPS